MSVGPSTFTPILPNERSSTDVSNIEKIDTYLIFLLVVSGLYAYIYKIFQKCHQIQNSHRYSERSNSKRAPDPAFNQSSSFAMSDIVTSSSLLLILLLCSFNKIDGFTTITPTAGRFVISNLRNHLPVLPPVSKKVHKNALVTYATIPKVSEQISIITTTIPSNDTTIQMGWDCNDEVECTEVPICTEQECRTSLDVRYHNVWYDVSGWRSKHPAGSHWIDYYDGRDATEVLDGFHTIKGQSMIQRLPKSKLAVTEMLSQTVPDDTTTQLNFRALKKDLETKGYWERNLVHEYTQLGIWSTLVISAAVLSHLPLSIVMTLGSNGSGILSVLSSFLLALSMTAAGWLGHDYIHGIDTFAYKFRNFAAVAAGLAPIWWSDKHNKVGKRDTELVVINMYSYLCQLIYAFELNTFVYHSGI